MYFQIQRIASLVTQAAEPHRPGFDPEFRLRQELKRVLRDVPENVIPADLQGALISGDIVGREAATWLPSVQRWLTEECQRTGD